MAVKKKSVQIKAFGRKRSIEQWSKEDVCSVTLDLLKSRLESGMDPEEAIMRPLPRKKRAKRTRKKYKGVSYDCQRDRYVARITVDYKTVRIDGRHLVAEDAARAYNRALRDLGDPDRAGRYNNVEPKF